MTFRHGIFRVLLAVVLVSGFQTPSRGQRRIESLDRGVVALKQTDGTVFISWRLLDTEAHDVEFNIYRRSNGGAECQLNATPLTQQTNFIDHNADVSQSNTYIVRAVSGLDAPTFTHSFTLPPDAPARNFLTIPTSLPQGYHANDASVGDLDGDGQYEIILRVAGATIRKAVLPIRRSFMRISWMEPCYGGFNLEEMFAKGAHYNPFIVFDLDGDGYAEFICRTADGTIDGIGSVVGDPRADRRIVPTAVGGRERRRQTDNRVGKVLSGPEYLTVFDGRTGKAVASVPYLPQRAPHNDNPSRREQAEIWGDDYGNRMDRFLATVAYLDGEHPSLVTSRGYYTRTVIVAWDLRDNQLHERWTFDTDQRGSADRGNKWRGQGNHSISTADVDGDSHDEIIFGAMVIDDDGTGLYSTMLGHGDAQHTGDLDPLRPGLETWSIHETRSPSDDFIGAELRDTRTGEILFTSSLGRDVGRGMAADIDPRHVGCEVWGGTRTLLTAQGRPIGPCPRSTNMAIWWDGDLQRELLNGVSITKWNYEAAEEINIFDGRRQGLASNNGSKSNPCLSADIVGDWREELIARTADNRELRIYVSALPTEHRLPTLMHDSQYRIGIAWQNVGYKNQPPHPSFFLGTDVSSKAAIKSTD